VKFAANGAQLEISFDSATDQAGHEGSFLCTLASPFHNLFLAIF
jgi:hypothetical protein